MVVACNDTIKICRDSRPQKQLPATDICPRARLHSLVFPQGLCSEKFLPSWAGHDRKEGSVTTPHLPRSTDRRVSQSSLFFGWDLGAFFARFGKPDGDGLLAAFDLLSGFSAFQFALLIFLHRLFDGLLGFRSVFSCHEDPLQVSLFFLLLNCSVSSSISNISIHLRCEKKYRMIPATAPKYSTKNNAIYALDICVTGANRKVM